MTSHVAQGGRVKKGQLLIEFDIEKIKKAGYPVITPVLVTNSDAFASITPTDAATISNDDKIITTAL